MMISKPMLAASLIDIESVKFPVYVTPKIDGVRTLKIGGEMVSRSMKPIRNVEVSNFLKKILPEGADGEIMIGDNFQETTSLVMSVGKLICDAKVRFYWFDLVTDDLKKSYIDRIGDMNAFIANNKEILSHHFVPLIPTKIDSLEELLEYQQKILYQGFEGVMLRTAHGPYKCGRSTLKEFSLVKMKKFEDDEAIVTGFNELEKNKNEKVMNELGYMKRSSHQDGKIGMDTMGSINLRWKDGVEFSVGSGFSAAERKAIWDDRDNLIGKIVKFRYFAIGVKTAPRFPTFIGFRDPDDM